MRLNPKTSQKIAVLFAVLIVSSLLLFQNCDQPLQGNEEHLSSFFQSLPFAYEAQVDTIAYMSCDGLPSTDVKDGSPIFTFYVGALRAGSGVRLTSEFLHETRYLEEEDKIKALRQSSLNGGAQAQLWIRTAGQLQTAFTKRPPEVGVDFDNILFSSLDDPKIAAQLLQQRGNLLNFFHGQESPEQRRFQGRVRLGDLGTQVQLRQDLGRDNLLSLNYRGGRDNSWLAKTPEAPVKDENSGETVYPGRSIYGLGLGQFQFVQGSGLAGGYNAAGNPPRVLGGLTEKDLETGQLTGKKWVCPPELRFMIVRAGDALAQQPGPGNPPLCLYDTKSDFRFASTIRGVLPEAYWRLNATNPAHQRCAYLESESESLSCYPSRIQSVNYAGGDCDPTGNTNACPHFVSICVPQ